MCSGFEPDGAVRLKGQINPQACEHFPRDHCILGHTFNHYPPISDAFDNRIFFLYYTNDSTLTLLRNSLFNINKQHIFFHCYKKHLKWGMTQRRMFLQLYSALWLPLPLLNPLTFVQTLPQDKTFCSTKSTALKGRKRVCISEANVRYAQQVRHQNWYF